MKQTIQLRGLSRTPSDRMTKDGGCAESLNVHLDNSETVPSTAPSDVSESLGLHCEADPIFIHKTKGEERLILLKDISVGYEKNGEFVDLFSFQRQETLVGVQSVGNTVIVCTSVHTHYILWKQDESQYLYLGTKIPEPVIDIVMSQDDADDKKVSMDNVYSKRIDKTGEGLFAPPSAEYFTAILNEQVEGSAEDTYISLVNDVIARFWESVHTMLDLNRNKGFFCAPVLARYALKLYDGSYIYQSTPFLIGAGGSVYSNGIVLHCENPRDSQGFAILTALVYRFGVGITRDNIFKIKATLLENYTVGNWGDVIKSIDLFLSPNIYCPKLNSRFNRCTEPYSDGYRFNFDIEPTDIEKAITDASNFYLIASFDADKLEELQEGYTIKPISQDDLLVKPTLQDDQFSHNEMVSLIRTLVYNHRIIYPGMKSRLYNGLPLFQAKFFGEDYRRKLTSGEVVLRDYYLTFYVRDSYGNSCKVYQKDMLDRDLGDCMPWLCYPDPRCYKATLSYKNNTSGPDTYRVHTFQMKEHPMLNCSYCFLGFGKSLLDSDYDVVAPPPTARPDGTRVSLYGDAYISNPCQLLVSEVDNPFVFPLKNRVTLSGDILGLAAATTALSTGQFGEYPLYAFTGDGIWALPISGDGSIAATKPLSREVAIKGTISPIDQAVVFATDKGVMLLSGSQVRCLSPNMNGEPYALESEVQRLLQGLSQWEPMLGCQDDTPFVQFVKGAEAAYDYAGERLIFFNMAKPEYQYVYMLATDTWHKIGSLDGVRPLKVLNGYPDALVSCRDAEGRPIVCRYSTPLEVKTTDRTVLRGLIATRPFDLGESDERKSINAIRIRGNFNRSDVKYILLGSMDGHSWQRLGSLRGGSYRLFRLVLLCELQPTERISYIDVEFDTRYKGKLR